MKTKKTSHTQRIPAASLTKPSTEKYILRLFVAGATARSRQAILHVQQLCAAELAAGCKLEVVDIYQQPQLARIHQIVATPTLIRELPRPVRRFIGSLLDTSGLFGELDAGSRGEVAV